MRAHLRPQWIALALLMLVGSAGAAATEANFREHCSKCHARPASLARSVQGNTEADRRQALEDFLTTHHVEDPKLRTQIVDYLIGLSG